MALRQTAALVAESARTEDAALQTALRRIETHVSAVRLPAMRLEVLENMFALLFLRKSDMRPNQPTAIAPDVDGFLVSPRLCRRLLSFLKDAVATLEPGLADDARPSSPEVRTHARGCLSDSSSGSRCRRGCPALFVLGGAGRGRAHLHSRPTLVRLPNAPSSCRTALPRRYGATKSFSPTMRPPPAPAPA